MQRAGSRLSYHAFDRMAAAMTNADSMIAFSDDPSPLDAEAQTFTPQGGHAIWAPVRHEAAVNRLGWHDLTGEVTRPAVATLQTVRRMGIVNGGQPVLTATLDYVLETSQTQTLRGCFSVRLRNHRQPAAFVAF